MEWLIRLGAAIIAGLLSVGSPCVLPVLPIIITGRQNDSPYRPLLIVSGLALTFILMGVISALFGGLITSHMLIIEKVAGTLIALLGILMMLNINPFKYLSFVSGFNVTSHDRWEGLLMGLTLGIIWIPCVGPFLSAVLFDIAAEGKVAWGVLQMLFYSIGFAIPMLGIAYASHFTRRQINVLKRHPRMISMVSGAVLFLFGLYILIWGLVGFGL